MQLQVPLLLKVLSYDRALNRLGTGDLVVAVLYDAANATSSEVRQGFGKALRSGKVSVVNGRRIEVVEINVASGQTATALRDRKATAAYVTPGLEGRLKDIVRAATETKVTLMGGSEAYARAGVAVGVASAAGKPQLFVNLPASRAAGADLPAALLNIAKVIQ